MRVRAETERKRKNSDKGLGPGKRSYATATGLANVGHGLSHDTSLKKLERKRAGLWITFYGFHTSG